MKQFSISIFGFLFLMIVSVSLFTGCTSDNKEEELDEYDGPGQAIEFEIERTRNLKTGKVPWEKLRIAMEQTETAKIARRGSSIEALTWIERGPNGDFQGAQGNPRPTGNQTSGRIRATMIDSLDPSKKTVWAGGVDGGLWKTTDITANPANWQLIDDYLANLAVADICQDPRPGFQNIMYFCTGESYSNADAVRGVGVFKSVDAGATWSFLSSTSSYLNGTRILCDFQGNVYLGTRNTGLLRSSNGGTSWTTITPSGIGNSICDLEISSTAVAGRLHVTTGIFSTSGYCYTDIPSTVTSGTGWNSSTNPFTTFNQRTEIAVSGNTLYAAPCNGSYQVPTIWKSTDGGNNWFSTATQPTSGWANGQGWYDLSVGINPANSNECIVGGLDCYKTSNGGTSWTKISSWATTITGFYVHADQHDIQWWDGGNKLLFACDGGLHYSSNGGSTMSDRNKGLRIKQFYSVAIHPTLTNYFIAGAQDNGVHRLNHPGLDSSIEVYGGDGCYVAIDQLQGQYQFGSYVFNVYRRSVNNGVSWSTPVNDQSTGRFVNPWDYDNNNKKIYACNAAGNFMRWNDPQTGSSTDVVTVSSFSGGNVSAVHVSPYTANRVFFGTGIGGIIRVDNANTGTSLAGTVINGGSGMPGGYVNCIVTGSTEQNMIACFTNYGLMNVWVTTNGGTNWTAIDGNLPDMPVRWALFHPDDNTKAFIATETGVWETDLINGSSTVWTPNGSFPNVRTDMIKYRASDRTIAAGTHGRGIFTSTVPGGGCVPASITTNPSNAAICSGTNTSFTVLAGGTPPLTYQWQLSTAGAGGPWNNILNGGVYSNATTATLNITAATAGMNTYQYRCVVTGNCLPFDATSNPALLTINPNVIAGTVSGTSPLCISATTTYTSNGTGGGTWNSTNTAVATVNSSTGLVTALSAGTSNITYTVNTGCGSPVSALKTLTVNPSPVVTCPANSSVSIDTPPFALAGGSPAGGTYSGTGVSSGSFDPAAAGVGVKTITYSYTNPPTGCSNNCTFTITVLPPFIRGSVQKNDDPAKINIVFKPTYTSVPGEYINYLQFSLAIPDAISAGVTATAVGVNTFSSLVLSQDPQYTEGTERIFTWFCLNTTPLTQAWTNGVDFIGVQVTFTTNAAAAVGKMVDFSNNEGGGNLNTFFVISTSEGGDKQDLTNFFYTIPGQSALGTYPSGDQFVYTTNDDAPGAIPLTVGGGCSGSPYTNAGATQSGSEPFAACQGTAGYKTVWYKFAAPASGAIKISNDYSGGTMGSDSRLTLFSATDVNNYATFSNIACDDDNGSTVTDRSVLYATGLTPGNTYYIQVDGKDGSTATGTFCLTVDELTSAMISTSMACAAGQNLNLVNNNYTGYLSVTDASSKLVALIKNPSGGATTSTYTNSLNINSGPVRTDAVSGQRYLDRNFSINNSTVSNVIVQFFILNSELTALQTVDAGVTLANLQVTRQTGATCDNDFVAANGTNSSLAQTGNGSGTGYSWVQVTTPGFSKFYIHTNKSYLPVKVFLQGAYNTGLARHRNNTAAWVGALNAGTGGNAKNQPYSAAPFSYPGTESVASFPASTNNGTDIMDWVLLELRDGTTPATVITRRAAFIRCDGRVVDLDGVSDVSFRNVNTNNYHLVIRHRNHLAIRTSVTTNLDASLGAAAPALYDFTSPLSKAFDSTANLVNRAMKEVSPGVFAMWAGNANGMTSATGAATTTRASGGGTINDYLFLINTTLGGNTSLILSNRYHPADMNMDGTVRASSGGAVNDYLFLINTVLGGNVSTILTQHQ